MNLAGAIGMAAGGLLLARWAMEVWLAWLNRRHVEAHAAAVPEAFKEVIDEATYAKSVQYTLARSRFGLMEETCAVVFMLVLLFSGVLPWAYYKHVGDSAWASAAYLFGVGLMLGAAALPWEWWWQFKLEERFGFNTTTARTWWLDRAKGLLLALALGYPLLVLLLKLAEWAGGRWWLWAWACVLAVQGLLLVLAPVIILPLFNKFTPLGPGPLCDRLMALARRTSFQASSVQLMDGSRRSRHANAFFTGLGKFRKIVLFDTLVQQLSEAEIEAVLAHEIGHWRLRHVPKLLAWSAATTLAGLAALAWLAQQDAFYEAFGFLPGNMAPAFALFGLLSGALSFWGSPLLHLLSRRYEHQADLFAADTLQQAGPLVTALRKLNQKNLANLTPHPLYSGFYYSHPTLLERERALARAWPPAAAAR